MKNSSLTLHYDKIILFDFNNISLM